VSGRGQEHAALERELAEFEGTEAALLFTSGYAANSGVIPALVGAEDSIFSDASNHASIIDGCRLSGARIFVYNHGDADHLRSLLEGASGFRRKLIVTDSLFSMDGDLAPLPGIAELVQRHGAMLMVDEAHATGVFGARGRGVAEHLGVEETVDVRVGTLSKALGCAGGFVAGRQTLIDWLANRARPYVFSTAAPEAIARAAREALRIVREEPERRTILAAKARRLRERLAAEGWRIGPSQSQIVPVIVGEPQAAVDLSRRLRAAGFFAPAIRPPSVPAGSSLLRISLSYSHSDSAIDRLADALREARPA
jgi:8-amino-7-oxononanoate synthase